MTSHPPSLSAQGLDRVYIYTCDLEHLCHMCHPSSPLICKFLSSCSSHYRTPPAFLHAAVKASSRLGLNLKTGCVAVEHQHSFNCCQPTSVCHTISQIPRKDSVNTTALKTRSKTEFSKHRRYFGNSVSGISHTHVAHLTLRYSREQEY